MVFYPIWPLIKRNCHFKSFFIKRHGVNGTYGIHVRTIQFNSLTRKSKKFLHRVSIHKIIKIDLFFKGKTPGFCNWRQQWLCFKINFWPFSLNISSRIWNFRGISRSNVLLTVLQSFFLRSFQLFSHLLLAIEFSFKLFSYFTLKVFHNINLSFCSNVLCNWQNTNLNFLWDLINSFSLTIFITIF